MKAAWNSDIETVSLRGAKHTGLLQKEPLLLRQGQHITMKTSSGTDDRPSLLGSMMAHFALGREHRASPLG